MLFNLRIAKYLSIMLFLLTSCRVIISNLEFNSQRSWGYLEQQVSFGPRPVGSQAHELNRQWIFDTLSDADWETNFQVGENMGHEIFNIVAKRGSGSPWVILGAHYDTRLISDQDSNPDLRSEGVLGANDGASGVAVLLELANSLPEDIDGTVWLVFFDAEDNGNIPGWDWILGSQTFVDNLKQYPDAVVVLDMIADKDLNIHIERNSNTLLSEQIWAHAEKLGYADYFIPSQKFSMLDDHTPFLRAGIPAVDIIDFDYPYWHTSLDNLDNVSQQSLEIVGDTILSWLLEYLSN